MLSLQQLLVPFQVFGIEVACAPVGKLNFLPHSPQGFFGLFHKLLDLLLVLQLEKLFLDSLLHVLLVLVLALFLFGLCRWGVVEVGEGESDEVEVELEFSEVGSLVLFRVEFAILLDNPMHFVCEEGLLVEWDLGNGLVEQGHDLFDISGEAHWCRW